MAYSNDEVKSGALIATAFIILFSLVFIVAGITIGEANVYHVRFGYVGGLENNAAVFFAGTEVGKVESIDVFPADEKPIQVTVKVDTAIQLREGTKGYVDMIGMMGEKIVEIEPGPVSGAPLESGGLIYGEDPTPNHVLMKKMEVMADRMEELHVSLNPILENTNRTITENQEEVAEMIGNFKDASDNIKLMTEDLKRRPWRLIRKGTPSDEE